MSNRLTQASWNAARRRLADRLKTMRPGELITIAEISAAVGYDMDKRRSIYYAAEKVAAVEAGVAFVVEHGRGYRCIHRTDGAYQQPPQAALPLRATAPQAEIVVPETATPPEPAPPDKCEHEVDLDADWQELKVKLGTAAVMVIEHWMRRP
jgi:hypothetical protein